MNCNLGKRKVKSPSCAAKHVLFMSFVFLFAAFNVQSSRFYNILLRLFSRLPQAFSYGACLTQSPFKVEQL